MKFYKILTLKSIIWISYYPGKVHKKIVDILKEDNVELKCTQLLYVGPSLK